MRNDVGVVVLAMVVAACSFGCRSITGSKLLPSGPHAAAAQQVATAEMLPIDSPIELRLHETLTPTGRPVELRCVTKRMYGYGGYIANGVQYREGSAKIEFKGVDAWTGGFGPQPARANIPLDSGRAHSYALQFKVNGEVVPAHVRISPGAFEMSHGEGQWITFPVPNVHRVPAGTIWGEVSWGPEDQSARAQAILDSLVSLGARRTRLAAGDYDYFQIDSDGAIIPRETGAYFTRFFVYEYDGDWQALGGLVQAVAGPVSLYVWNDLGQHWYGYSRSGAAAARMGE